MSENETNQSNQTNQTTENPPAANSKTKNENAAVAENPPAVDETTAALSEAISDIKTSLKIGDEMQKALEILPLPQQLKVLKGIKTEKAKGAEPSKAPKDPAEPANPAVPNPDIEPEFKGFLETNARDKMLAKLYERAKGRVWKDVLQE